MLLQGNRPFASLASECIEEHRLVILFVIAHSLQVRESEGPAGESETLVSRASTAQREA